MCTMETLTRYFYVHPRATRHYVPNDDWPRVAYRLEDVYASHSVAKGNAFYYWRESYRVLRGRDWTIKSATCQFFTVQFVVTLDTGDDYLCIATGRTSQAWRIA